MVTFVLKPHQFLVYKNEKNNLQYFGTLLQSHSHVNGQFNINCPFVQLNDLTTDCNRANRPISFFFAHSNKPKLGLKSIYIYIYIY